MLKTDKEVKVNKIAARRVTSRMSAGGEPEAMAREMMEARRKEQARTRQASPHARTSLRRSHRQDRHRQEARSETAPEEEANGGVKDSVGGADVLCSVDDWDEEEHEHKGRSGRRRS